MKSVITSSYNNLRHTGLMRPKGPLLESYVIESSTRAMDRVASIGKLGIYSSPRLQRGQLTSSSAFNRARGLFSAMIAFNMALHLKQSIALSKSGTVREIRSRCWGVSGSSPLHDTHEVVACNTQPNRLFDHTQMKAAGLVFQSCWLLPSWAHDPCS